MSTLQKMADQGAMLPSSKDDTFAETKGKGKSLQDYPPPADISEEDDEDEGDDDENENEDDENAEGGEKEDGMEEIDLNNIVDGGRRTRGANIDFAAAAENNPAGDDDEEEDDEDFQPPTEHTEMRG